jgi:hypothetical protein
MFWVSCKLSQNEKLLPGTWTGVEWLIEGRPAGYNVANTAFQFNADGTYAYLYGDAQENGAYFVTGQELYTTPEGGEKMMVRIKKLTTDTLVFEMNRGGTLELLTLVRQ